MPVTVTESSQVEEYLGPLHRLNQCCEDATLPIVTSDVGFEEVVTQTKHCSYGILHLSFLVVELVAHNQETASTSIGGNLN